MLCVAITIIISGVQCHLEGRVLKVAAEHWDPFFVISEGEEAYSGLMEKVLDYLRLSLNFSTSIIRDHPLMTSAHRAAKKLSM